MSCPRCGAVGVEDEADCPSCLGANVCRECGTALPAQANFCSQCGQPSVRAGSIPPAAAAGSVSVPAYLSQHVVASRAALSGERKHVTVMFADLRGSLNVISAIDPEEGQALLDAVVATMVDAVHRYEGAVGQVMGDGIMALFGAPIAHEDHALRAACAALAMQEAVRELQDPTWEAHNVTPQIRVGLNSGEVAIRTIRSDLSMDYRAVGATTHIASRMEQLAPPGAIFLTQHTFDLGQGLLRTKPRGPMPVKGVPEPIEVHELTGISVRTRFQANALRGLSPLVGRAELIARLDASLALAEAGRSQVAVLHGEPGVGKSRLCHELLQRAGHARVLEASSLSYLSTRPHGLLASMVRALFGIGDDHDPTQVRAKAERCLRESYGPLQEQLFVALELLDIATKDARWQRLDPQQKRRAIEDFLRQLLLQFCARGASIVLCEDLHWSDPESLAFVASLVEAPPGEQTLLLLTHRPDFEPPWAATTNPREHLWVSEVTSLSASAAESLLVSILGDNDALAPLRSWLAVRTDGNPFFIEESVRTLREHGLVEAQPRGRSAIEVPASIDALLGGRVDRLPEAAQDVLRAAAVLGDAGSVETLRAVCELEAAAFTERFEQLTRAEMLYEVVPPAEPDSQVQASSSIRFKHALIQEVVYKRLLRPHKRALHARVVEVIETQHKARLAEHVESLAEHAYRAELWEKCTEYEKMACIRAANRGANGLALMHLERGLEAVEHMPHGPERARAQIDMRLIALAPLLPMGAHARVIALLREAEQSALELNDTGRLARVCCQLVAELWCTAQYASARVAAEQALQLSAALSGDHTLQLAARYNLAMVQHALADFAAAREGLEHVLQGFKGYGVQRRLGWAGYPAVMTYTFMVSVAVMTGDFADAARAFAEGSALARQFDHGFSGAMILEQYGMCLLIQGEYARAEAALREAHEICQRQEVHTMRMPIGAHLGLALLELDRVEEALVFLEEADAVPRAEAGHYAVSYLLVALAESRRRQGQLAAAREIAELAVQDTATCGERGFHVRALIQLARVLAELPGEEAAALQQLSEAERHARELEMPPWAALALQRAGVVHTALGNMQEAIQALDAALTIWQRLEVPARITEVTRCQQLISAR